MVRMKRAFLLAGAAALTLTGAGLADPSLEDQNEVLRTRIAELERRLVNVEQQGDDNWMTEQRAEQIKALVQDVLADADTRSSMLAQGMTAGYDNGAVIASADGNWLLRTNMLLQTRFMLRSQNANQVIVDDGTRWGFEVTRAKFILSGNVVSPEWFYNVSIDTSDNDNAGVALVNGDVRLDDRQGLLDAYAGYDFGNGLKLMGGNMKVPLVYEDLMEDQYQQAVERSLLTYLYTGGYSTGIAVDYMGDQFHVVAMWSNGISDGLYGGDVATSDIFGTIGTNNSGSVFSQDTSIAITGRFEWLAMGSWDQFRDYTSPQGDETGVLVGAAFHWQQSEHPNDAGATFADISLFTLVIDAAVEFGGANVYGALVYSDVSGDAAPPSTSPWGFQVGGGWYFTEDWELFGRYEYSDYDNLLGVVGYDDLSIITFGVNKYFAGHNAKWTTDFGFATNTNAAASPVTGWNFDDPGEDGQFVLRSQLQILF